MSALTALRAAPPPPSRLKRHKGSEPNELALLVVVNGTAVAAAQVAEVQHWRNPTDVELQALRWCSEGAGRSTCFSEDFRNFEPPLKVLAHVRRLASPFA
eukprot:6608627-Alexandrium_andersonii.AAC.1